MKLLKKSQLCKVFRPYKTTLNSSTTKINFDIIFFNHRIFIFNFPFFTNYILPSSKLSKAITIFIIASCQYLPNFQNILLQWVNWSISQRIFHHFSYNCSRLSCPSHENQWSDFSARINFISARERRECNRVYPKLTHRNKELTRSYQNPVHNNRFPGLYRKAIFNTKVCR